MLSGTKGLRYYLLRGAANLEPFRIFRSQRIDWHDHEITFYVLGTSHAVALGQGGSAFTELLSCVPATQIRILEESGVDVPRVVSRTIGDVVYSCRLGLVDLATLNDLHGEFAHEDTLSHSFDPVGRAGEPVTRIGWQTDGARLHVRTLHTYPEEGLGVTSHSVFRPEV